MKTNNGNNETYYSEYGDEKKSLSITSSPRSEILTNGKVKLLPVGQPLKISGEGTRLKLQFRHTPSP